MPVDEHLIQIPDTHRVFDRRKILFVLLLFLAMTMLAVSSVNVVLTAIADDLNAGSSALQWVLSGYTLVAAVSLVPAGRVGDAVGRSALFVLSVLVFSLGSLICGLATDPLVLNIGRLVQGVGGGIAGPQITGMIQQYFTGRARAVAFGFFGLVISASVTVGPLVAGAIIAAVGPDAGWRWSFLMNIPVGLVTLVLALLWLPFTRERTWWSGRRTRAPKRVDLDPVGQVLLVTTVLCLMFPFLVRGQPLIWLLLLVVPVALYAWVRWERRYRAGGREPMVDLGMFAFRTFSNQTRIMTIIFIGQTPTFVLLALYVQSGLGGSALEAGLVGAPATIASAITSLWASRHALVRGRGLMIAAMVLMLVGITGAVVVALLQSRYEISYLWLAVPLLLNGLGMGAVTSTNQTLALQEVPPRLGGTASGVKMTAERIATTIGITMITGIFLATQPYLGWAWAFGVGYATTFLMIGTALVLALADRRQYNASPIRP